MKQNIILGALFGFLFFYSLSNLLQGRNIEPTKPRELTIYTTQGIYYINIDDYSVTEENQDLDEPIYQTDNINDLDDWIGSQTARDANIGTLIPRESFVYGGSYWNEPMPVTVVCNWENVNPNAWQSRLDTIGWIYPTNTYSQIIYKPL